MLKQVTTKTRPAPVKEFQRIASANTGLPICVVPIPLEHR